MLLTRPDMQLIGQSASTEHCHISHQITNAGLFAPLLTRLHASAD